MRSFQGTKQRLGRLPHSLVRIVNPLVNPLPGFFTGSAVADRSVFRMAVHILPSSFASGCERSAGYLVIVWWSMAHTFGRSGGHPDTRRRRWPSILTLYHRTHWSIRRLWRWFHHSFSTESFLRFYPCRGRPCDRQCVHLFPLDSLRGSHAPPFLSVVLWKKLNDLLLFHSFEFGPSKVVLKYVLIVCDDHFVDFAGYLPSLTLLPKTQQGRTFTSPLRLECHKLSFLMCRLIFVTDL